MSAWFFVAYNIECNAANVFTSLPIAISVWLIMLHTSAQFARECVSPSWCPCITFLPSPFPGARSPRHQLGEHTQAFRSQKREDTSYINNISEEDRMLNSAAWFWRIAARVSSAGQYSRLMISAGLELAVYTSHLSRSRSSQHSHSDLILS